MVYEKNFLSYYFLKTHTLSKINNYVIHYESSKNCVFPVFIVQERKMKNKKLTRIYIYTTFIIKNKNKKIYFPFLIFPFEIGSGEIKRRN